MDISILHLSDLHITVKNGSYSEVLGNLIDDVKEQCSHLKYIILVITGDIIDKAQYTQENISVIIDFFNHLKVALGDKIIGVQVVPGNHDKKQHNVDKMMVDTQRALNTQSNIDKATWRYFLVSFQDYINMVNQIRSIFDDNATPLENSYYVEYIDQHDFRLIFINLDTAWASLGGSSDLRQLKIDEVQLTELKEEYQKYRTNTDKPVYTIMVAHHPLNWLNQIDESFITPWLFNSEYFNINFYLCGHTHDRQIKSILDTYHSYVTLVTGIGWDEKNADSEKDRHRYSIYNIDFNNQICEIIIRKTKANGTFDDDSDVLLTEFEKETGKIYLPLNTRNSYPIMQIPFYWNAKLKKEYLFINNSIIEAIQKINKIFFHVTSHMDQFKHWHIADFFVKYELTKSSNGTKIKREVYFDYFYNNKQDIKVIKLFEDIKNKQLIYDNFVSYLRELCGYTVSILKDNFPEIIKARLHFRKLYFTPDKDAIYIAFCQATTDSEVPPPIRDVDYQSLIQLAFEHKQSFVYKHTPEYNPLNMDHSDYDNFVTMTSSSHFNIYRTKQLGRKIEYPHISASLSLKTDRASNLLDVLNFLGIDDFLFRNVEDYIELFKIDLADFISKEGI